MVFVPIETGDRVHDGVLQVFDGSEVVIVDRGAFQVAPKAFDQVEIRGVGGVPYDRETVPVFGDVGFDRSGVVDGTVVQEQVEVIAVRIDVVQQPLKEFQKLGAAFALRDQGSNFAGHGIQSSEDRHTAILTGRGNDDALAPLRPAAGKAGIQMKLGFVDIRESTTTGAGFRFFKARAF